METKLFTVFTENEIREMVQKQVDEALSRTTTNQPEPTEFLTRNEVSDLLGVSLVTVWDWSKKGIITPYKINSRIRFKKSDVLESVYKNKL